MIKLFAILLALWICVLVKADTEIRNFRLPFSDTPKIPLDEIGRNATKLHAYETRILQVSNSSPEAYVTLEWEDVDLKYDSWTIRLSWPGSSPTKWDMKISPIVNIDNRAVVHIRGEPLSPKVPSWDWESISQYLWTFQHDLFLSSRDAPSRIDRQGKGQEHLDSWASLALPLFGDLFHRFNYLIFELSPRSFQTKPTTPFSSRSEDKYDEWKSKPWETTFSIILEPLYLGVLPKTAVPAVCLIVVFAIGAGLLVPRIIRLIETLPDTVSDQSDVSSRKSKTD